MKALKVRVNPIVIFEVRFAAEQTLGAPLAPHRRIKSTRLVRGTEFDESLNTGKIPHCACRLRNTCPYSVGPVVQDNAYGSICRTIEVPNHSR
jgi:hypothetical protein